MSSTTVCTPEAQDKRTQVLGTLRAMSDAGLLRHLDSAFAAFIATLDPGADPALLVATAMLSRMEGHGHSCLPMAGLPATDPTLFGWPTEAQASVAALWHDLPPKLEGWLGAATASPTAQRIGRDPDRGQPLVIDGPDTAPRLYLRRYWQFERTVGRAIIARCRKTNPADEARTRAWLDRFFARNDGGQTRKSPVDWQKIACAIALRSRLTIITGGPGTGKTYTAARLLAVLLATAAEPQRLRVALAAPTGKAAARLKQSIDGSLQSLQASIGNELDLATLTQRIGAARTLHSLLGARPDTRRFRHHAGNPLDADIVIVDEASMVHLEMMAALLEALPERACLILLGDKDQLASVEAGAVLGDLCRDAQAGRYSAETARYLMTTTGEALPDAYLARTGPSPELAQQTVMLRESLRFDGPIGALALAVNDAKDPALPGTLLRDDATGSLFVSEGAAQADVIESAVGGRPGASASYLDYTRALNEGPTDGSVDAHDAWTKNVLQAFDRFRLLCAVREGDWGVSGLNRAIERKLESARQLKPQGTWYKGRPVMVTRNDPTLGIFNGDIGIALPAAESPALLRVYFLDGERLRSVAVSRLAHVETAFAMTVHKSQGSEFEHTMLVLSAQSGNVLTRELIYTGITRARKAFSLFAERPGLLEVGAGSVTRRESGLLQVLEEAE
ncbi:exodeoxyribonuclease V subunit alpha [Thauera aromatica]|uniref:RecBCD enzyme subunit RecD n=1 Tax=Thauera aromatica K172 TaxID=44139 RepID=A0A2R4BQ34_THAAR|nr:exodeoxyribonuclease V subunit alpha [Thauera aromatica]AVR89334.1 Exodeoxyribonuclease V alpha chain [Thauera aromatica K172]